MNEGRFCEMKPSCDIACHAEVRILVNCTRYETGYLVSFRFIGTEDVRE
jgi:hypothetical protein